MSYFAGIFYNAIKEGWHMFWSLPKDVCRGIVAVLYRIQK